MKKGKKRVKKIVEAVRLPAKDSSTWRGIITGIQTFIGFCIALLAIPEFRELVLTYYPQAASLVPIAAGVVSFLYNLIARKDVANY